MPEYANLALKNKSKQTKNKTKTKQNKTKTKTKNKKQNQKPKKKRSAHCCALENFGVCVGSYFCRLKFHNYSNLPSFCNW